MADQMALTFPAQPSGQGRTAWIEKRGSAAIRSVRMARVSIQFGKTMRVYIHGARAGVPRGGRVGRGWLRDVKQGAVERGINEGATGSTGARGRD